MEHRRIASALLGVAVLALSVAGCGGSSWSDKGADAGHYLKDHGFDISASYCSFRYSQLRLNGKIDPSDVSSKNKAAFLSGCENVGGGNVQAEVPTPSLPTDTQPAQEKGQKNSGQSQDSGNDRNAEVACRDLKELEQDLADGKVEEGAEGFENDYRQMFFDAGRSNDKDLYSLTRKTKSDILSRNHQWPGDFETMINYCKHVYGIDAGPNNVKYVDLDQL
jgi:hypothetical protein